MEIIIHTLNDLPGAAKQFIDSLGNRKVVVFNGDMGAGKTTFITAVLKAMGIPDPDGSPTYAIVNTYQSLYFGPVYHLDVYRLDSLDEALETGVEELLYSGGYCFIEWGEKIAELLPDDTVEVSIAVNEQQTRVVTMHNL